MSGQAGYSGASATAGYSGGAAATGYSGGASASYGAGVGTGANAGPSEQIWDPEMAQQASVYTPGAAMRAGWHPGQTGAGKRDTVIRKGGGRVWEDRTLLDWDHSASVRSCGRCTDCFAEWWRLFVGNVSNDVNERTLDAAFNKYPSYVKSKVVRDRLSEKVRTPSQVLSAHDRLQAKYGFIAFKDPEDFLKAWKEMDGPFSGDAPSAQLTRSREIRREPADHVEEG